MSATFLKAFFGTFFLRCGEVRSGLTEQHRTVCFSDFAYNKTMPRWGRVFKTKSFPAVSAAAEPRSDHITMSTSTKRGHQQRRRGEYVDVYHMPHARVGQVLYVFRESKVHSNSGTDAYYHFSRFLLPVSNMSQKR